MKSRRGQNLSRQPILGIQTWLFAKPAGEPAPWIFEGRETGFEKTSFGWHGSATTRFMVWTLANPGSAPSQYTAPMEDKTPPPKDTPGGRAAVHDAALDL